ncbi:MAG TPA: hypothetical protein VKW06_00305 [Candidatus Angelobacter sp.]|nr:hypothetical protein [Candidatus Angelobacter sp.]
MTITHTFSILPVSPATFKEIQSKLKAAGYDHALFQVIDMHGIALKVDDGKTYMPTTPARRKHPLAFVADQGLLAEALGLSRQDCIPIEEIVEKCLNQNKSMRELFEMVSELEISDELWASFLYTYGWWDGRRRY